MKIDRRNLRHWLYLALFALNVGIAIALRTLRRRHSTQSRQPKQRVILYGHKLGGNLLALYRTMRASHADGIDVHFLTMDPAYYRELTASGKACLLATSPACIASLASVDAIISDHGLHALSPILSWTDVKFFDVWHGIAFKGFDADDFRVQHRYDEVWVASPSQRDLYIDKFGFDPGIVHATGYARTDQLVRGDGDIDAIKRSLGLDPATCGKLVLFAPTWKQDTGNRSLFPFGLPADDFLQSLGELASNNGATVLLRTHLNSDAMSHGIPGRVLPVPYARFPETEAILLASDVLVCDWSSIAFDYLLLGRPTIFLDVPAPFRKGFSLGPEYRYGELIDSLPGLLDALQAALADPKGWHGRHSESVAGIREAVYGACADGKASARCIARMQRCLGMGAGVSP